MSTNTVLETGTIETTCERCGVNFTCHKYWHPRCPKCDEEEIYQRELAKRLKNWEAVCPGLYRKSDRDQLPPALVRAADGYQYGAQGLGFIGPTGLGKTRSMMLILRRMIIQEGRNARYVRTSDFTMEIAAKGHEIAPYIEKLCTAENLLFDDLGKSKLSESAQGHLFHIIETRTANLLPVLFTSNADADGLAAMMTEDRAAPLLRRLKEFCEIIKL